MTSRCAPLLVVGGLAISLLACGSADRSDSAGSFPLEALSPAERQLVGAWSLAGIERRSAAGEPLTAPVEDRLGYLIYDASGYMGVTIMRPGRAPYAEDGPTADEALAQFGSYTSYFGRFTADEAEGAVTHHVEGSLNPNGVGSDYTRFYTLTEDRLTLQPPSGADGSTTLLTWVRQADLPASETTDTHRQLFGAYRIDSRSRHTTDGYEVEVDQYENGYLFYTPSGHMSVHLMRPGRAPFAGDSPTADEALRLTETYASYFGPFSVREMAGCITCPGPRDQGYLTHHRIGNEDPRGTGTDARRYYELTDTHLTLRPPVGTDDEGREVVTAIRWERLPTR
ncbi:MAG: lipocalin-like domain-containing protein [Acidobacteria bacterium]|nr:lipocalin-like domain-containing protein [Acidobacteriota bacterium]